MTARRTALLFIAALLFAASTTGTPRSGTTLLLDSWQFRHPDSTIWRSAAVPGSIHHDLLLHGVIPDPGYAGNEAAVQWVGDSAWEYRCRFTVTPAVMHRERNELVFEGLDTYARVVLNGETILEADNMFRIWRVDVTGLLRPGPNDLEIRFTPPGRVERAKREALGYGLPGGDRVFTRKAAFHYGWDWGPRLVTMGVWRPVRLESWDTARIRDLHLVQRELGPELARMSARFEIESLRPGTRALLAIAGERSAVALKPGTNTCEVEFEIEHPRLWWPNGAGEQNLYRFEGTLSAGGSVIDARAVRAGLRTLQLAAEPDSIGRSFYFIINGRPLFMKGANYIPLDNLQSRAGVARYVSLLDRVAAGNMNMLRVWGGGIYEEDRFYDLCDERGILVWQDFMFACAIYPGDRAFMASVQAEIIDTVKRLRNHPCIALWCGNNEISEGWHRWGWQEGFTRAERDARWRDYTRLFGEMIPRTLDSLAADAAYWESSPAFGRGDPRHAREGDAHDWGVWHDGKPFETLETNVPRFMSEFGMQSFPVMETIEAFVPDSMRYRESPMLAAHQKHPRGFELIDRYIGYGYRPPSGFEQLVYLSQVMQAEGIVRGIEAHRRARPRCMGTLYWQLNDCWPAISWSSIDYFGRPKALYYLARHAFEEVIVSFRDRGDTVSVYAVSDRPSSFEAQLRCRLIDFSGAAHWDTTVSVAVAADASTSILDCIPCAIGQPACNSLLLHAELIHNGDEVASSTHFLVPPRDLALEAPNVRFTVSPAEGGYRIVLDCDRVARRIVLSSDVDGVFSDNFLDLIPGMSRKLLFRTNHRFTESDLHVTTLFDSYQE